MANRLSIQWRRTGRDVFSYHQPHHCLLNRLFWRTSKKTSKLRVTGLCAGNSPVTGEFPAQMARNTENVSIGCRHHNILSKQDSNTSVIDLVWPGYFCLRKSTIITSVWERNFPYFTYHISKHCHEIYILYLVSSLIDTCFQRSNWK